jgi:hypothetical protein
MGRKSWDSWEKTEAPLDSVRSGGYEDLAIFGRAKKEDKLFRAQPPGPIRRIDPITGESMEDAVPKSLKNKPVEDDVEDEELEEGDEEETEDNDDAPSGKKGRGNPGNLTPREPVSVSSKVFKAQTEEVQKLLKQRDKLLAAGDQKGLRKVRAMLRKAGFRLSNHAGAGDKIANAQKAKAAAATEKVSSKKSASDDEDEED